jgi:hypothetical protein
MALHTDGLDRDARRANEWFRRYVPRRSLRQWQGEGARLVARQIFRELTGPDSRPVGQAKANATRSA